MSKDLYSCQICYSSQCALKACDASGAVNVVGQLLHEPASCFCTFTAQLLVAGGSVNDKNAADIASKEDVDGFLVGGASLKGDAFLTICNANTAAVLA